jgi:hypothetical protein
MRAMVMLMGGVAAKIPFSFETPFRTTTPAGNTLFVSSGLQIYSLPAVTCGNILRLTTTHEGQLEGLLETCSVTGCTYAQRPSCATRRKRQRTTARTATCACAVQALLFGL